MFTWHSLHVNVKDDNTDQCWRGAGFRLVSIQNLNKEYEADKHSTEKQCRYGWLSVPVVDHQDESVRATILCASIARSQSRGNQFALSIAFMWY